MSKPFFLNTTSQINTAGATGLTRSLLIVTRETVAGFTADPETGLYKINKSDYQSFVTLNPTKLALIDNLEIVFGQTYFYPYVYILSKSTGVTLADLTKANARFREWSFITIADKDQCFNPALPSFDAYIDDLQTINTWNVFSNRKIVVNTISKEEVSNAVTIPAEFLAGGEFVNTRFKTVVSNVKKTSPSTVYRNVILAQISFCINGIVLARSFGSFSDANNFLVIEQDSYSSIVRSYLETNNLGQYNDRKDKTGKKFFYDTLMNENTLQIEALTSADYIEDYVYVYINNILNSAGETGLTNDDAGIQKFYNLILRALANCFENGLILSKNDGTGDYSVSFKTANEVTAIDPTWQTTGVWVSGMYVARVRPFSAAHYIDINFIF